MSLPNTEGNIPPRTGLASSCCHSGACWAGICPAASGGGVAATVPIVSVTLEMPLLTSVVGCADEATLEPVTAAVVGAPAAVGAACAAAVGAVCDAADLAAVAVPVAGVGTEADDPHACKIAVLTVAPAARSALRRNVRRLLCLLSWSNMLCHLPFRSIDTVTNGPFKRTSKGVCMKLELRFFSITITIGSSTVYHPALVHPGYF
jgi:hypothetical protein